MPAEMIRALSTTPALAALLLVCSGTAAQTLRCETSNGKVTYANTACPEGSRTVRTLPPEAGPTPEDAKAARERLKNDRQKALKIDRERRAEEDKLASIRAADGKRAAERERACRKLALRVTQAEDEAGRAALNKRESAEKRLERAREQFAVDCKS